MGTRGKKAPSREGKLSEFAIRQYKKATWQRYCQTRRKWVDREDHEHLSTAEASEISQQRMDANRRYQSLLEAYESDDLGGRRFRETCIKYCDGDEFEALKYVHELQRIAECGPCLH